MLESPLATATDTLAPARNVSRRHLSLFRGIEMLVVLLKERRSLGITQIATALDLPKSTAHDLIAALCELGFVEQQGDTRRYAISPRIFEFLNLCSTQYGANLALKPLLREQVAKLRASVVVTALSGRTTYVLCASGPEADTFLVGDNGPAYCSACGKILISQFEESAWVDYAPLPGDKPRTPYSKLDREQFFQELRVAREQGVAWSVRERVSTLCSVAAPIRSWERPWNWAVGIIVPSREWDLRNREELAAQARELAERISLFLRP